jgi:hypothetical protein
MGRADSVRTAVAAFVPASLTGRQLMGPTLITCAWSRSSDWLGPDELLQAIADPEPQRSRLVFTNRELESDGEAELIGPIRLGALVAERPVVSRRVPSLLGVRELPERVAASNWDRDAALALTHVFAPTRAYRAALDILERHHFAVLTGPPEMGKTAIARILGLALELDGWQVHECTRAEQVRAAFARDQSQLFIADDAFGSTEYRPDAAEDWALELDRILRAMDERHWLIWTSRPAPLKAGLARIHREHGVERFPRPAEIGVDAAHLDVEEKASILYRHARAAALSSKAVALVRRHGVAIVGHPHFTPQRINRFVGSRLPDLVGTHKGSLRAAINAEIAQPTEAMQTSFSALSPEHKALLVALLDAPAGPVAERDLASSARRHAPEGLSRPPGELVDRLTDHFLRLVPPHKVTWVHPSWRDLVIDELAADAHTRRRFLERCSIEGVLLALSRAGGRAGQRQRPLLRADGDWDALTERVYELVPQLTDPELLRLLTTLTDSLTFSNADATEPAALSTTLLRQLRGHWERGDSFANEALLERWHALALLLPEEVAPPRSARLWELPPPTQQPAALEYVDQPFSRPKSAEQSAEHTIIARILADL